MRTDKQKLIDLVVNLIPKGQRTYYKFNWISSRFLAREIIKDLLELENESKS